MTVLRGLRVSYREGKPFAAYFYLGREQPAKVVRSRRFESGIVADFADDGSCLGLELTAPGLVDLGTVNKVLRQVGVEPVDRQELQPLLGSTAA